MTVTPEEIDPVGKTLARGRPGRGCSHQPGYGCASLSVDSEGLTIRIDDAKDDEFWVDLFLPAELLHALSRSVQACDMGTPPDLV